MPTKLQKAKESATRARARLATYRGGETARAGMNGALVIGGAMGAGALEAVMGDTVAGIPTDAASALILCTAGAAMDSPALIYLGFGAAASWMQLYTRDSMAGMFATTTT